VRIALVRPLLRSPTYDPEIQEPLGIESLAGALRAGGHEVVLRDAMLYPRSEREIARDIAKFDPDAVGVSLMGDADIESAAVLLDRVRELAGGRVATVVGGSLVSTDLERFESELPNATFFIRFDGERPLLKLLEAIEHGGSFDSVPSLAWRDGGQLIRPSTYELVDELDANPWPARDLAPDVARRFGVLNVQGSRGCTGRCSYCCVPAVPRSAGATWRGRSPHDIARELGQLHHRYGVVAFNFVDDDFLGPARTAEDRARSLADAISEESLCIGFGAQLRPYTLNLRTIEALARAGLAYAFVGIENDEPDTLKAWRRPPVSEDVWQSIDLLRQRQVDIEAGIILFHPEARLHGVRRLVGALVERELLNYRTATSRLHLLPGSHLYDVYKTRGDIPDGVKGPFTPPIRDARVESLFVRLSRLLAPLRPCWVHAACRLPGLVSQFRAGRDVSRELGIVRRVLRDLDQWVRDALEALITDAEKGVADGDEAMCDLEASRQRSLSACDRLVRGGLVSDPQQLRDAIAVEGVA